MDVHKIIIGICSYNRANSLRRCLSSVVKLNYTNCIICVVDNNSTDNTREVVSEFYGVKYIFEPHSGVSYARNAFLDFCEHEVNVQYVAFLDDDETVNSDWISAMLECFESNKKIAVVCGPYFPVYFESPAPSWIPDGIHNINEFNKDINACYEKFGVVTGNCMCRYDVIKNSSIRFREELGRVGNKVLGGEDTEFFDRLIQGEYLYGYTYNAPIYHYIEKERLLFDYFVRRFFYQGVSEYLIKGNRVVLLSMPKVVGQTLRLCLTAFVFNKDKAINNFLKLTKTIGIISAKFLIKKK